jgi:hypothetical protein
MGCGAYTKKLLVKAREFFMANINCPLIGSWKGTFPLEFAVDGTLLTAGQNQTSFLVWEMGAARNLVTISDVLTSGLPTVTSYTFTLDASGNLVIDGKGQIAGKYAAAGGNTPAPMDLSGNDFLGSWMADVTGGMGAGAWSAQYAQEAVLAATHLRMNHTFSNAFVTRRVSGFDYLLVLGQMRFGSPVLAQYEVYSNPRRIVAKEVMGGTSVWTYTPTPQPAP